MQYLGIDPSQRHTGVCLLQGDQVKFIELKPEGSLLECGEHIQIRLYQWLMESLNNRESLTLSVEKQGLAGYMSLTLFYAQMAVFQSVMVFLKQFSGKFIFVNPLPVQLKSYLKKKCGVDITSKSTIVESFKKRYGTELKVGRISQHLVEAFYLAQLGRDVIKGEFSYKPVSWDISMVPWEITYKGVVDGDSGRHSGDQEESREEV